VALYTVAANYPPAAADLNQAINLLSAASSPTDSVVTVSNRIRAQLTGATATSGLVGSTGGGPPSGGTFALGDLVVDTGYTCLWVCTTAGTPGTWTRVGGQGWTSQTYSGTGQTFFTRSGRTGFDVLQLTVAVALPRPDTSNPAWPYGLPGFSTNVFGFTIPAAGVYAVNGVLQPNGGAAGADLAIMILKNGAVYQFGSQMLSYGSPVHKLTALVRCAAGDILQMGVYSEGQYAALNSIGQGGMTIAPLTG
jgi:hypothetical protein